jgi:hypothetical protein
VNANALLTNRQLELMANEGEGVTLDGLKAAIQGIAASKWSNYGPQVMCVLGQVAAWAAARRRGEVAEDEDFQINYQVGLCRGPPSCLASRWGLAAAGCGAGAARSPKRAPRPTVSACRRCGASHEPLTPRLWAPTKHQAVAACQQRRQLPQQQPTQEQQQQQPPAQSFQAFAYQGGPISGGLSGGGSGAGTAQRPLPPQAGQAHEPQAALPAQGPAAGAAQALQGQWPPQHQQQQQPGFQQQGAQHPGQQQGQPLPLPNIMRFAKRRP